MKIHIGLVFLLAFILAYVAVAILCYVTAEKGQRGIEKSIKREQRMTNADKIRSMSDYELAEFLYDVSEGMTQISVCDKGCDKCANDAEMCTALIERWLK